MDAATQNIRDFQMKFFEIFNSQDPENISLDVVFDIGGKKLYGNKSRLAVVSTTFESMFSERWTSKDGELIKINNYSFEDFTEFLTFIYSGKCTLTDENILAFIDMAEFYGIQVLKTGCDEYLSKMKITMENALPIMETSNKYSLVEVKKSVQHFLSYNLIDFIKSQVFLNARKETVEVLVTFIVDVVKPEELFQAVYEWVELQAKQKVELNDGTLNETIKAEIIPFLQYIRFKEMNMGFLVDYVVQRGFLFSYQELSEILNNAMNTPTNVKVKVTNSKGQAISGYLPRYSDAVKAIKSLKNRKSDGAYYCWWKTKCTIPSTPSTIKIRNGVEWYLVFFPDGDIGARYCLEIRECHYLLAEMTLESSGFALTANYTIEIE